MTNQAFILLPIATIVDSLLYPILSGGLGAVVAVFFLAKLQHK